MNWADIAKKEQIFLNLGGGTNCHPKPGYEGYISVDLEPPVSEWAVKHDIRDKIPLADGSVTRIHSEDFLEHIAVNEIHLLLKECYRLLKIGGRMRIGVPDYKNPKDRHCLEIGKDLRFPLHITMTDYPLIKKIIEESPFTDFKFYHYWEGDTFIQHPIDYASGIIKRTPDNDSRCRRTGLGMTVETLTKDIMFIIAKGFRYSGLELATRKGHRFYITSIVVDLFKS